MHNYVVHCLSNWYYQVSVNVFSATEELDTENEFLLPPVFGEEYEEQPRPRSKKKVILVCC